MKSIESVTEVVKSFKSSSSLPVKLSIRTTAFFEINRKVFIKIIMIIAATV